MKCRDELLVSF